MQDLQVIPLQAAQFCEACQTVNNSTGRCAVCGSQAIVNLSRLIAGAFEPHDPLENFTIEEICSGLHLRRPS